MSAVSSEDPDRTECIANEFKDVLRLNVKCHSYVAHINQHIHMTMEAYQALARYSPQIVI